MVLESGGINPLEPPGPVQACAEFALPLPFFKKQGTSLKPMLWSSALQIDEVLLYFLCHSL